MEDSAAAGVFPPRTVAGFVAFLRGFSSWMVNVAPGERRHLTGSAPWGPGAPRVESVPRGAAMTNSPHRFSLLRNHPVRRDPAAQSRRNPRGAGRTKGRAVTPAGEADRSLFGMSSSEQSQPVPVAVAFGDGIGPAIMEATLRILEAAKAPILPERIEIVEVYLCRASPRASSPGPGTSSGGRVFLKAPIMTPEELRDKSLRTAARAARARAQVAACLRGFSTRSSKESHRGWTPVIRPERFRALRRHADRPQATAARRKCLTHPRRARADQAHRSLWRSRVGEIRQAHHPPWSRLWRARRRTACSVARTSKSSCSACEIPSA